MALLRRSSNVEPTAGVPSGEGSLTDVLDDGAVLHRTLLSYVRMTLDGASARAWLRTLGEDVAALHDDPRGVLFFPDVIRIRGRTYAEVVREIGHAGVWVAPRPLCDEDHESHVALADLLG